jgi:hypothetical protein
MCSKFITALIKECCKELTHSKDAEINALNTAVG